MASDHTYAFSFREADDQEELKQAMEEWLTVKEEMLVKLRQKLDSYKNKLSIIKNGHSGSKGSRRTMLLSNSTQASHTIKP